MSPSSKSLPRAVALFLGCALVVAGAGIASARIASGPPWSQEPVVAASVAPADLQQTQTDVQQYLSGLSLDQGCTQAVMGTTDLTDPQQADTLLAFGALVDGLSSGQTSHTVQSIRVLMGLCDQSNTGLQTALSHHITNWLRLYEHEMWLRQKFADKWPDGKPGGNPNASTDGTETVHGRPDWAGTGGGPSGGSTDGSGPGNGHAFGQGT